MSNTKDMSKFSEHGFTAVDNRLFYLQEMLSPISFCLLIRVYRMTEGYNKPCVALSNGYFQKTCNLSKNTVTKNMKELEDLGIMTTKRRARASTYYKINMDKVAELFNEIRDSLFLDIEEVPFEGSQQTHEERTFTTEETPATIQKVEEFEEVEEVTEAKIPFKDFWNTYDKKVDSAKCKKKWEGLTLNQQKTIMQHIPRYVESTPIIKYRKNPITYLNGKCWKDEIIDYSKPKGNKYASSKPDTKEHSTEQQSYEERMQQQFNEMFC